MQTSFKIKSSLLVPFVLDTCLFLVLLVIAIFGKGSSLEIGVLCIGLVPLLLISIEMLGREILMDEKGLTIRKMFREKRLLWEEITHVGSLVLNKKVYLLLTTTKGFHILSNAYGGFTSIVGHILDGMEKDRIEDGVSALIDSPVKREIDIILSWVAAVILLGAIWIKLFG